jgi:hypothetical protein
MKRWSKVLPMLGILILFFTIGVGQVFADCESGELEYGDECEGRFREGDDPVIFSFEGEEGDLVTLTLEWEDDAEGVVGILGPIEDSNQEDFDLNESDEGRNGEAQLEELELPGDGLYAIIVNFTDGDRIDWVFSLEGGSGGSGRGGGGGASGGINVECEDGTQLFNGATVIVNMRADYNYTVTAIGVDGYDPTLAVGTVDNFGLSCSEDARAAEDFGAALPTTGEVEPADESAQVIFSHSIDAFANITITVGSEDGDSGDFILIVEGLAYTVNDGPGDPYTVFLTPNLTTADVPLTVYMFGEGRFNPFLGWVQDLEDYEFMTDGDDNPIFCDDAGNRRACWNEGVELDGFGVTTTEGAAIGDSTDAMISADLSGFSDLDFENDGPFLLHFVFGTSDGSTGDYTAVFHIGVGD